jgi:hypothetical protein
MPEASYGSHDAWKHEDERRFRLTLGLSVAFHVLLLLLWKLPAPAWKAADAAVLTVVLRGAATALPKVEATSEPQRAPSVLRQMEPAPATFSIPARPPVPAQAPPAPIRPSSASAGEAGRKAAKSAPGKIANASPAVVGVAVKLVTDDTGRANQIYWSNLPALTDEQLRRVEAAIRARRYAPGQIINDVFDVREFLKLPPARRDDALVPIQEPGPVPVTPGN